MRWRGVSVMSREGQLLSQKPHSMQRSTMELAGGLGFRCFTCTSGSCNQENTPNLSMQTDVCTSTRLLEHTNPCCGCLTPEKAAFLMDVLPALSEIAPVSRDENNNAIKAHIKLLLTSETSVALPQRLPWRSDCWACISFQRESNAPSSG